jgi:hypothetical protein
MANTCLSLHTISFIHYTTRLANTFGARLCFKVFFLQVSALSTSPHSFCTTSNSSRFDSSSAYLGWNCCCTPLSPLCPHGHHDQALRHCHPSCSARTHELLFLFTFSYFFAGDGLLERPLVTWPATCLPRVFRLLALMINCPFRLPFIA